MCGIFAVVGNDELDKEKLQEYFMLMKARGPDESKILQPSKNSFFGIHRLNIIGGEKGSQPIIHDNSLLICNGEIYNHVELENKYGLVPTTTSDCEIILLMHRKFGIERTVRELDGVFSFVILDADAGLYAARDPIGIRPLFLGIGINTIAFSSEIKSLTPFCKSIMSFAPGSWWNANIGRVPYFSYSFPRDALDKFRITQLLRNAVRKRLMSDRPIAALLSGGLDSSIIAALVAESVGKINTYAIGMKGSPDLKYADIVAKHINSNHFNLIVEPSKFVLAIEPTIKQIESYDVTTVRASVGNYVMASWISQNSEDKVIFCGDVSDEIFGGYRGFSQAPNSNLFHLALIKMLADIHYFDVLRSDRSVSGAGLESRVPYADKEFLSYIMSIDAKHKEFKTTDKGKESDIIEKKILRDAFRPTRLLPDEIIDRRKEAFSDGVSGVGNDWFTILQDHAETLYTDDEFESLSAKYEINKPFSKESLWYREIFEKYYKGHGGLIPYFWRHPFEKELDPSARKLSYY